MGKREGWEVKTLGEIADVQSGGTPLVSNKANWNGDIPWYSSGELNETFTSDPDRNISRFGIETSNAKIFPKGSLLIGMYDTAALKMAILDRDGAFNQAIAGVKPNPKINLFFVLHAINEKKETLLMMRRGVRQKNLSLEKIRTLPIPIPPLAEQQRIVRILDEAFAAIATAKATAEKNLQNARALFESYLQSVFTKKGEEWVEKTIGEVSMVFDGPHATPKTVDKGPIFLGISSLDDGKINLGETRHVTEDDFKQWTRRVKPEENDIVFSYETRLGQAAIIPPGLKCCLGRRMALVRPNQKFLNPRFFVYQFISPPFRNFIKGKTVRGATVDRISLKEFPGFPISLPPLNQQIKLADELEYFQAQSQHLAAHYQKKITALDELKKSLLHQAFNGDL